MDAFGAYAICTVTFNSNFAILKIGKCFQLELKDYLSLMFRKESRWGLAPFKSIFSRNRSLSNVRLFQVKRRKIGKNYINIIVLKKLPQNLHILIYHWNFLD